MTGKFEKFTPKEILALYNLLSKQDVPADLVSVSQELVRHIACALENQKTQEYSELKAEQALVIDNIDRLEALDPTFFERLESLEEKAKLSKEIALAAAKLRNSVRPIGEIMFEGTKPLEDDPAKDALDNPPEGSN